MSSWQGTLRNAYKTLARAVLDRTYQDLRDWPPTGASHPTERDKRDARLLLAGGGTYEIVRGLAEI